MARARVHILFTRAVLSYGCEH